ncbi:MAG: hypothetical protein Greene041662_456 [Candidatus Peregrinibacteria bacterium Greene0416_62]|nr:MAG: hypothetical protein Greene041662_456 [Candidatus Peregrinibacteria bacterium Greene0416_62]TSC99106.1 MAG: hypothetical protein Greene101449_728 [Candidatus Peregrinibacteria bacterium Greene1014_49]
MNLPAPLKKIYDAWMSFSHILGRIMSTILLTILWIIVFGLYAIVLKIVKLFSKTPSKDTYWIDVSNESTDMQYQF